MSHDGMIEFEENGYDKLVEVFIMRHRDKWEDFVYEMYQEECASQMDNALDEEREREVLDENDSA